MISLFAIGAGVEQRRKTRRQCVSPLSKPHATFGTKTLERRRCVADESNRVSIHRLLLTLAHLREVLQDPFPPSHALSLSAVFRHTTTTIRRGPRPQGRVVACSGAPGDAQGSVQPRVQPTAALGAVM